MSERTVNPANMLGPTDIYVYQYHQPLAVILLLFTDNPTDNHAVYMSTRVCARYLTCHVR